MPSRPAERSTPMISIYARQTLSEDGPARRRCAGQQTRAEGRDCIMSLMKGA
jgi:hypothetical protein